MDQQIAGTAPRGAAAPHSIGTMPDGRIVETAVIAGHGLTAAFLSYGATLQGLWLNGHSHSLVVRLDRLEDYLAQPMYVGALVGRYANRIGGAQALIEGLEFRFDPNWLGRHTLHGGAEGSGQRLWQIGDWSDTGLTLTDTLPDGHMGFPGRLEVQARFAIGPGPALTLDIAATTDAPTLCGFAQHSYWNLDGARSVLDHRLRVAADHYLPVDGDLIPLGQTAPVEGTPYDFRAGRGLGQARPVDGYDHNLCLSGPLSAPRAAAWLSGTESGLTLRIETTEPGLQVYDGAGTDCLPGMSAFAGVALEPQNWPDAPNRAEFPPALLLPGQTYRQTTRFVIEPPDQAAPDR